MARHNRDARGTDQRGAEYAISYQPDWLGWIKVTRTLESGRQSTKTLFRNPARAEQAPGERVRTHIKSRDEKLDFEIVVHDPGQVIRRVIIETSAPGRRGEDATIVFTVVERSAPRDDMED